MPLLSSNHVHCSTETDFSYTSQQWLPPQFLLCISNSLSAEHYSTLALELAKHNIHAGNGKLLHLTATPRCGFPDARVKEALDTDPVTLHRAVLPVAQKAASCSGIGTSTSAATTAAASRAGFETLHYWNLFCALHVFMSDNKKMRSTSTIS
jgi:hypothetical protein